MPFCAASVVDSSVILEIEIAHVVYYFSFHLLLPFSVSTLWLRLRVGLVLSRVLFLRPLRRPWTVARVVCLPSYDCVAVIVKSSR